jgi:hypothetical protein
MLISHPFFCTFIQLFIYLFTELTHLLLHVISNHEEHIGKISQNFPKLSHVLTLPS